MTLVTLAIVGAGPRALWALEELSQLAAERNIAFDVSVFDPGEPGIGAAYDPDQPAHRLVNVRSSSIATAAGCLDDFLGTDGEFVPRRDVGRFLTHSWQEMLSHLPPQVQVSHVRRRVGSLAELDSFDHVLLVTGHAAPSGVPDSTHIQAGTPVAIRGAALTFIDVVLDLTLGRGGRFDEQGVYVPAGTEPSIIAPFTRSGAAIQVKPAPATPAEREILERYRPAISNCAGYDDLVTILCAAATDIVGQPVTLADAAPSTAVEASWRASLAADRRPPQALGFVWRELYPEIVERVSFGRMDTGGDFFALTRLLEPLAYGPPPAQIARLLALIDAHLLDVSHLDAQIPDAPVIDAVLSPAGINPGQLEEELTDDDALKTDSTGRVTERISSVGRASEPYILGHDTLSRGLHDVIPRWARRLVDRYSPTHLHGIPPLEGRREAWMDELCTDPATARQLIDTYGSPVNVHDPAAMSRNIEELADQGARVFFARKANKSLVFVDTVRDLGHGVDVASYHELRQVLERRMPPERIIVSAAIKTDQLIDLAIDHGVIISVDSVDELRRVDKRRSLLGAERARVAPRLAPDPALLPPTRFGETARVWAEALANPVPGIEVVGIHCHLHGYAVADRITALGEVLKLIDALTHRGHAVRFVDLGGGVPMSYFDAPEPWENFQRLRARIGETSQREFTWKKDPLSNIYPFYQTPQRGEWLAELLASDEAQGLAERGVALHLEPGRSVLDGCGMTLARVAFIKTRSDGLPLVGLEMNRTQLRTAADDYLIDPIHLPGPDRPAAQTVGMEGYFVGAYCIEDEVIVRRRMRFPAGVAVGDVIAFVNTAGYFMHILESASHQIPLARNIVRTPAGEFVPDDIDGWTP